MFSQVFSDDYEENFVIVHPQKSLLSHLIELQGI